MKSLWCLLFLIFLINHSTATKPAGPKCVEDCNREWSSIPIKVPVCTTWKTNHLVSPDILTKNCYSGCQLSILYPGTCKCPNNCHVNTNQGKCSNSGCICNQNWTGPSCSIPKKVENSFLNLKQLPFGDLFGDHFWSKKEKYKDNHPVFNTSRMASVHIKLSQYDQIHLLNMTNLFNNTWLKAEFNFDNGIVKEHLKNIGIRLKGSGGRMQRKKGFKISFTAHGNSGRRFFGLRRIGFKGQQENLTGAKSFITSELYRSMSVPVQRGSFSKIYINDVFYGVYWMGEEIEKTYIASRYKGSKGSLYRCFFAGFEYIDDNQETYKRLNFTWGNKVKKFYDKKLGDSDNFSDLVRFITILNKTTNEEFPREIEKIFEVENYLRQIVVEIATANWDGYTVNHNNYMIYNDSKTKKFNFISFDFDMVFYHVNLSKIHVYQWPTTPIPFPPYAIRASPLTSRLLSVPKFRKRFTDLFYIFLEKVFNTKSELISRIRKISEFLKKDVEKDLFYELDYFIAHRNMRNWMEGFKSVEHFIESRYKYAMNQLD